MLYKPRKSRQKFSEYLRFVAYKDSFASMISFVLCSRITKEVWTQYYIAYFFKNVGPKTVSDQTDVININFY